MPPTKPKAKSLEKDDPEQSKRFLDAAREAEADETEGGAEKAFRKVAGRAVPKTANRKRR